MNATHEVQVWDHKHSGRTRWYACAVVGTNPAPANWLKAGLTADWPDVRLRDGSVYPHCNPECVRVRASNVVEPR